MARKRFASAAGLSLLAAAFACGGSGDDAESAGAGASAGSSGIGGSTGGAAGKGTAGSGTAGSGTAGSGTAGSGTAGSGTAGSGTAGTGTAGSGGGAIPPTHPRIYMQPSAKDRLVQRLAQPSKAAKRFRDMVDSQIAGTPHYAFEPWNAGLLGALGGDAKYCAYAVSQTDAWVAGEEALVAAGKAPEVAGDSYLDVGGIVGGLAMVFDHCHDALSAAQKARFIAYGNQAVWNVWHPSEAKWGSTPQPWTGWSIDNPFNNYHYSFLRATMLLGLATSGENPDAAGQIDQFRKVKLPLLVSAFEEQLQGGGSREGTGYGTSHRSLFELYDFWEATTGEKIWDLTSHTRASLPHFMHGTVPTLDRIAPIGDHARDSTASFFDYHREQVLVLQHLLGKSDPLTDVAQTYLEGVSVKEMGQAFEFVWDFLYADDGHAKAPLSKLLPTYHGKGTGVVYARSGWTEDAVWGGFLGGPYTESHAHHDQGSLLFYRSTWLAYDENIDTHSGIQQGEEHHNLVRLVLGGKVLRQQESKSPGETTALADAPTYLHWAANLAPLYGNAAVKRDGREIVFLKDEGVFVVFDRVEVTGGSSVYQLNAPVVPTSAGGRWTVDTPKGGMDLIPLAPAGLTATVVSWPSVDKDYLAGARLDLAGPGDARYLTVLAPKGRVTTATVSTAGGSTTATLSFSGGGTAKVAFQTDAAGGHLTTAAVDVNLVPGVATLPLFAP